MLEAIGRGLYGLVAGFTNLHWSNPIMIAVGWSFFTSESRKILNPCSLSLSDSDVSWSISRWPD